TAEDRLDPDWLRLRGDLLGAVWFPKHPRSIMGGDLLVYYAAGRGVFPAVVEVVTGDVEPADTRPRRSQRSQRWPWRMDVRPRLVIPHLDDAPTLEQTGINPLRLRRQSHILLTTEEWEQFRALFLPP